MGGFAKNASLILIATVFAHANANCVVEKVRIVRVEGLAKLDSFGGKSDPYAKISYSGNEWETNVQFDVENFEWNELVGDSRPVLPSNKLSVALFDYDTLGGDDFLGKTETSLVCPATYTCKEEKLALNTQGSVTIEFCINPVEIDASCPTPTYETSTCDWYRDCLDKAHPCGGDPSEYAMNYGFRKCNDFGDLYNKFSENGRFWLDNTRACLQRALVPRLTEPMECKPLRTDAFVSHVDCYLGENGKYTSICDIVLTDLWVIVAAIRGDLFSGESVDQAIPVLKDCAVSTTLSAVRVLGKLSPRNLFQSPGQDGVRTVCTACEISDAVSAKLSSTGAKAKSIESVAADQTVQLAKMQPLENDQVEMVFLVAARDGQLDAAVQSTITALQQNTMALPLDEVLSVSKLDVASYADMSIDPVYLGLKSPEVQVTPEPSNADQPDAGLSPAVAAGIGAGVVAFVALAALAVVVRRKRLAAAPIDLELAHVAQGSGADFHAKQSVNPLFNRDL